MRRILKGVLLLCMLTALAAGMLSCTSQPAAVPAPPIELPTPAALKFVSTQGLSIDLGNISTGQSIADALSGGMEPSIAVKAVAPGTSIKDQIVLGPNVYNQFHEQFFLPILRGIEEIEIPAEATRTNYSALVSFSNTTGILQGDNVRVDIDFADFDFDGDGATEGCSGNSLEPPICVRLWLAGARFLAGVFLTPPTYTTDPVLPDALGEGSFRVTVADLNGSAVALAYRYRQYASQDATKDIVSVEFFSRMTPTTSYEGEAAAPLDIQRWDLHASLLQSTPVLADDPLIAALERAPLKRFNESTSFEGDLILEDVQLDEETLIDRLVAPLSFDVEYLGQYVQDGGFWGGSYDQAVTLAGESRYNKESDLCATLPDGIVLDSTDACENVGGRNIRVYDDPFVDPLTAADVLFPADMPATPPLL